MQQFQVQKRLLEGFLVVKLKEIRKSLRIFCKVSQDEGKKPRGIQDKTENK